MENIRATSADRIALLASQSPTDSFTTSPKQQNDKDTVHYLSPVTTARPGSEYEGDAYPYALFQPRKVQRLSYSRSISTISCEESQLQRTLAIIKPEAMVFKDVVLRAITESGLKILTQRTVHLSPEQVAEIYQKFYGNPVFPHMVVSMSVAPIFVMCLSGLNAIEKWKAMVGPYRVLREEWFFPYSVRTRFGMHNDLSEALHASETISDANVENRMFSPKSILEPLISNEEKLIDYLNALVHPTLLIGLAEVVRVKPLDPIIFLAEWLLLHNPFQPKSNYQFHLAPT